MGRQYSCVKCSGTDYETGQLRAAGGFWSKIFDIQSRKLTTVSCTKCGYTELYKGDSSMLGNVFDFLTQ